MDDYAAVATVAMPKTNLRVTVVTLTGPLIIARLNGKLWVESSPGKGAVFFFEIPLG